MDCSFCESREFRASHPGKFHKVTTSFGPFDIVECQDCGSMDTVNKPDKARLSEFYRDYDLARPDWFKEGAANAALAAQYRYYSDFIGKHLANTTGRWIEVGAGGGDVSTFMKQKFPKSTGVAVDIGPRPAGLDQDVDYISADINEEPWNIAGGKADLVFSVAVWEHVLSPEAFARQLIGLTAPKGSIVIIAPDYGSAARKLTGERWPYFSPGEHLSVPTRDGATRCATRQLQALGFAPEQYRIKTVPISVGYSISYVMSVLGLGPASRLIPPTLSFPMPTGILATVIRLI